MKAVKYVVQELEPYDKNIDVESGTELSAWFVSGHDGQALLYVPKGDKHDAFVCLGEKAPGCDRYRAHTEDITASKGYVELNMKETALFEALVASNDKARRTGHIQRTKPTRRYHNAGVAQEKRSEMRRKESRRKS